MRKSDKERAHARQGGSRWAALLRALRWRAQAWQPLENGWRCVASDHLEVQITRAAEVGWQVALRDTADGRLVGRPTLSPRLDDAARIGRYLRARHGCCL